VPTDVRAVWLCALASLQRDVSREQELRHENVVALHEVFVKPCGAVVLVLDFVDGGDLAQIIDANDPGKEPFVELGPQDIKKYTRMLMQGVAACHARGLLHRDLKPSNLLVDSSGTLRLSDFGNARQFGSPAYRYTPNVCTRWYRPPELLMGCNQYRQGADMWSVGCIIAEMFLRQVCLPVHGRAFRVCSRAARTKP
jgi:cyclin-dependent kinase 7